MAVWIWIGRLVVILAIVAFLLLKAVYAMIMGFLKLVGIVLLGLLFFEAFDCSPDGDA